MKIAGKEYKTIWFQNNVVKIIDQTKLPHKFIIKDLKNVTEAINAIKKMEVRGAPLIGVAAAFGMYIASKENSDLDYLKNISNKINSTRPTAVNLSWALNKIMSNIEWDYNESPKYDTAGNPSISKHELIKAYIKAKETHEP